MLPTINHFMVNICKLQIQSHAQIAQYKSTDKNYKLPFQSSHMWFVDFSKFWIYSFKIVFVMSGRRKNYNELKYIRYHDHLNC